MQDMRNTLLTAFALLLVPVLIFLPTPDGLLPQGQALLAITAGMLVLWITQSLDFSASSFYLVGLMSLCCGLAEDPALPGHALGVIRGVKLAMQGFGSSAWILVTCALFLAASVDASGLGRRLSLRLLALAGSSPRRILWATLGLVLLLCLIIPAPVATSGLCTVLMLSVVRALDLPLQSNLSKSMFFMVAFVPALAAVMILTAGGGPIQMAAFIYQGTGKEITWMEFFIFGAPLGFGLCIVLYALLTRLFPVSPAPLPGVSERLCKAIEECGPFSRQEKAMAVILCIIIPLWATSKVLHPIDNSTIAILAVCLIFFPGMMGHDKKLSWFELCSRVPWGTMCLFGAVLSLGQALLDSGGAAWFARTTLLRLGIADWPLWAIACGGAALFGIFGLAFSARSAAVGALTPTIIGFAQSLPEERGISVWGLTLVLTYAVQFTILVPANSPMAMIAMTSNSFSSSDMARLSAPLILIGFALILLLSLTWWPWLGVL